MGFALCSPNESGKVAIAKVVLTAEVTKSSYSMFDIAMYNSPSLMSDLSRHTMLTTQMSGFFQDPPPNEKVYDCTILTRLGVTLTCFKNPSTIRASDCFK